MKIAIIINAKRMTQTLHEKLTNQTFVEKYNINYDLFIKEPEEIPQLLSTLNHQSYNAYLIGGGDGTVSMLIKELIGSKIPIAILPLGTFNLLAKSIGYPNDIDALMSIIKNNKLTLIDVAQVNDKIIVNHAWIGFYYHLLKRRKQYSDFLKTNRLFKSIFNFVNAFKSLNKYTLDLKIDNKILQYKTSLIFIANNEAKMGLFDFGQHKYFTSGVLAVTILNCKNRWQLFYFIINAFFKKYHVAHVTRFTTSNLVISGKNKLLKIVIDGELYQLENPLKFSIHHNQLTVILP